MLCVLCCNYIHASISATLLYILLLPLQKYNGSLNGRVWNASSVTVFLGSSQDDPIVPVSTCKPDRLEFGPEDEAKVRELRMWWSLRSNCRDLPLTDHVRTFSSLEGPLTFNVCCYVVKKVGCLSSRIPR